MTDEITYKPTYYAQDGKVFKSPVQRKRPDGSSSITLGFPVCEMAEWAGADAAPTVAALMNRGELAAELLAVVQDCLADRGDWSARMSELVAQSKLLEKSE